MTSPKQSAFRRYRALLVLVPLVAAGVGAFFYFQRKNITLAESPFERVPRIATAVLHVDVAAVVGSPLWQRIVVARGMDTPLTAIRERCGFDPVEQLHDLTFFAVGERPSELDHVGLIAEGPFQHEKLAQCVRQALEAEGGGATMSRVEIDGVPAVASSSDQSRAAFLGERGIAAGMLPVVRSIIATARKDAPNASGDPVLSRLWTTVSAGREIVLVGHLPTGWQDAIANIVGGGERVATVSQAFNGLKSLGIGFRVSTGLGFGSMLVFTNAEQSRGLAERARAQIETLKNNIMVSLTPVGPVLRSVQVEHRNTDVIVTLDIPQERLDRLLEFADSLSNPSAAGTRPPGAPGAPGMQVPAPAPTMPTPPAPNDVVPGMQ